MSSRRVAAGAFILAAAGIAGALACGPDFPWQLFDDRDRTVSEPIGLSFAFQVSRLVDAPSDGLRVVEPDYWAASPDAEPEAAIAERREAASGAWPGLGVLELTQRLAAARGAEDGQTALSRGVGLPVAVATYIAAAVEFRADRLDAAAAYFAAIDQLPPEQRQVRAVASAYMQGRIHQRRGAVEAAQSAFRTARVLAQAGAPDPMGLAVASLGEEARMALVQVGLTDAPWPMSRADDDASVARLVALAVRLYAEQMARGSRHALESLSEVARVLVGRERELGLAVADPLVRRLIVAYIIARDGQSPCCDGVAGPHDSGVRRVIAAMLAQPDPVERQDADRLAALAYQAAHYDVAEQLTRTTDQALGLWVRAKLALRRGDRDAAARDWAAALTAIENARIEHVLDDVAERRVRGEAAVVRVSQGE
jgi:cellulose synthase operon protein C